MRIEAVTVCRGYSDFLSVCAPYNRGLFDRWLIVTDPADAATREVCRRLDLECLLTEDGSRDGTFAKGRMIERGLSQLSNDGWKLHLDGDIVLPAHTRAALEAADLDPACIYGIDRVMVKSAAAWRQLRDSGYLSNQHDYQNRQRWPAGVEVGARWADVREGWAPIGFFQLMHAAALEWGGSRIRRYPVNHGDACRTDVQFAMLWDRRKRVLLPEIVGVHLESADAPLGANWKGRTTPPFVVSGSSPPLPGAPAGPS